MGVTLSSLVVALLTNRLSPRSELVTVCLLISRFEREIQRLAELSLKTCGQRLIVSGSPKLASRIVAPRIDFVGPKGSTGE